MPIPSYGCLLNSLEADCYEFLALLYHKEFAFKVGHCSGEEMMHCSRNTLNEVEVQIPITVIILPIRALVVI